MAEARCFVSSFSLWIIRLSFGRVAVNSVQFSKQGDPLAGPRYCGLNMNCPLVAIKQVWVIQIWLPGKLKFTVEEE